MLDFLFFLPGKSYRPIGGYKVVFEYANTLVRMGYQVGIIYVNNLTTINYVKKIRNILAQNTKYVMNFSRKFWFDLDKRIKIYHQPVFNINDVPDSVVTIATAWDTAFAVNQLTQRHLRKYYLIQGYEIWSTSVDRLLASYGLGLENIAVSRWLQSVVQDSGNTCSYLPNGLDHAIYYLDQEAAQRLKSRAITLYHPEKNKGFSDVLDVCAIVKQACPNFELYVFGAYKKPESLPSWVRYFYLPTTDLLRNLYNSSAIFVSASRSEGWGLTACEAMQCGCAVCLTNIDGYKEFAINGVNALLSITGDINGMASNVVNLLNDDQERYKIAHQGTLSMEKYNWDLSAKKLLRIVGF